MPPVEMAAFIAAQERRVAAAKAGDAAEAAYGRVYAASVPPDAAALVAAADQAAQAYELTAGLVLAEISAGQAMEQARGGLSKHRRMAQSKGAYAGMAERYAVAARDWRETASKDKLR